MLKASSLNPNSKIAIVSLSSGTLGSATHQLQLGIKQLKKCSSSQFYAQRTERNSI